MPHRLRQLAPHHKFVVDGNKSLWRNLLLQGGIAARRGAVGIRDKQDYRRDPAPRRLLHESDFPGHLEELIEVFNANIVTLVSGLITVPTLHPRHLPPRTCSL